MRDRTVRMAAPLAWAAILLFAIYLVFIGGGWQGIYSASLRAVSLGIIAIGLAVWAIAALADPAWRPRSAIWPIFPIALGAFTLSALLAPDRRTALEYLAWGIVLTALYLLLQRLLAQSWFRSRIGAMSAILCLMLTGASLLQVSGIWLEWWDLLGRLGPPPLRPEFASLLLGNPSAVMTVALLLYLPAVAGIGTDTRSRRLGLAGLGLLVAAVVITSGSRSGWVAVALAVFVTVTIWLVTPGHRGRLAEIMTRGWARAAVAAAVLVAVAAGVVFAPGFIVRAGAGGEALRLDFFATALRMFSSSPLVGVGPGGWAIERMAYTVPPERDYYVPHAHNVYLQTGAEFGLVGLVAGGLCIAAVIWLIRRAIVLPGPRRVWGWAALFGAVYFAAHNLLDFYANMPTAIFAFAIPIAWLDATETGVLLRLPSAGGRGPLRVAVQAVVFVLAGLAVIGLAVSEQVALQHQQAVAAANQGDWDAAYQEARRAADADPDVLPYRLTLGLAAYETGRLEEARAEFARVATADLPVAWLDLAAADLALGDNAAATTDIANALRLGYADAAVALPAGELLLELGNPDEAVKAFADALAASPELVSDGYWKADPRRADLLETAIDLAIERLAADPARLREAHSLAVLAGRQAEAESFRIDLPADQQDVAELAERAWSGDAEAARTLVALGSERPLDVYGTAWAVRAARLIGDTEEAERLRRMLVIATGSGGAGASVAVIEAADRSDAERLGLHPVERSTFWGHYSYRRPVPWDQVVGGLPRVATRS